MEMGLVADMMVRGGCVGRAGPLGPVTGVVARAGEETRRRPSGRGGRGGRAWRQRWGAVAASPRRPRSAQDTAPGQGTPRSTKEGQERAGLRVAAGAARGRAREGPL